MNKIKRRGIMMMDKELLLEISSLKTEIKSYKRHHNTVINYAKKYQNLSLYGLLLAFVALIICFAICLAAIQNFNLWKDDVEKLTYEQTHATKDLAKIINDQTWIHLQRLMIEETIKLNKAQIEDLKKLKIFTKKIKRFKEWEAEQRRKEKINAKKRHVKPNVE